jgi:NADPH:quinone reductase-like Zn-dependent oxidoreductase
LNKLQFVDCPVYPTLLGPHDVEVSIAATGLNFRDVMCAMGEVAGDVLGAEGAGTVTRTGADVSGLAIGDRVALLASYTGCFATHARTVDKAVVALPDEVSFEEAAGMPVTTCTAYYSLVDLARLSKGESVLIHAAAGGVGQAAIMLAQHLGANIFATVSTEEKKNMLIETYGIPEDHVLYSRDLSFGNDIMRLTKDRGVDVVLNSLAGEALRVSWNSVAPFGRFVEIGKRDIYSNGRLDMFPFSKNITFTSCDLETVMKLDQPLVARLLRDSMLLWSRGIFRQTTPLNVFPYSNIESSFRLLQSGKHIGKIVLVAGKDDVVPVSS